MKNTPCYYCPHYEKRWGQFRYPDDDGFIEIANFRYIYCKSLKKPVWSEEYEDPVREIPEKCYICNKEDK